MLINNPESLKSWLVVVLEPLCDADSSALARYVLALLKKDKPMKELKKVMIEQLDVFLAVETKPFVERLFNAISTEEYLKSAINNEKTESAVLESSEIKTDDLQKQNNVDIKTTDAPTTSAYIKNDQTPPVEENKTKEIIHNKSTEASMTTNVFKGNIASSTIEQASTVHVRSVSSPVKTIADKENQPRESRRRRASLRSRSRSRSRSNDRISRRSRSRDRRTNDREKNRQFRNKSPPLSDPRHASSHERRRTSGGADRRRIGGSGIGSSDDRSPRFGGNGGEVRKSRGNRSNSRSRSPSLDRSRAKGSPLNARPNRGSPDRHRHLLHESEKRQRCRDFDEKGYCVRGETCPWDHGVNPVVFEGINNSALISMSLREYNPDAPDLWTRSSATTDSSITTGNAPGIIGSTSAAGINPFTGSARPGSVMVGVPPSSVGFPHVSSSGDKVPNTAGGLTGDYPRNTSTAFRGAAPMIPFPFNPAAVTTPLQRELIPIPVVDAGAAGGDVSAMQQIKRRFELEDSVAIADGPTKRKIPLNSRLGPRIPNIQNNCSLELRKIPRGLNTIAHLNNHFAKFGKIVNIQVSYDGDPEAAIITFSTHAEANVAYRSTEAVLNNRFIKVFWHNQDGSTNVAAHTLLKEENSIIGSRKNSQYHVNNIPAIPTPTSDSAKISNTGVGNQFTSNTSNSATVPTTTTIHTKATGSDAANVIPTQSSASVITATCVAPTSLRLKNNVSRGIPNASTAMIRKKQEEQAKAVVQLANGLRKRKQELLQSYVKQMKSALELVERCDPNDPQRGKTLATIKVLQETIDKLRREIAAEQEQIQAQIQNHQPPLKKTKEQQKKELLDIELELIAQQQEGNDTSAIQKRLEELQRSLGVTSGNVHTTGNSAGSSSLNSGKSHFGPNRANNRMRPTFTEGSTKVDRRPKTIVVTGFTKDEADFVLGHFKHFGEITKHDVDKEIPQIILSYATRSNAEQAVLRGKMFKDKRLQISWAPVITPNSNPLANLIPVKTQENKNDDVTATVSSDIEATDTLPELRLEDEEEEEESEDRSWRR